MLLLAFPISELAKNLDTLVFATSVQVIFFDMTHVQFVFILLFGAILNTCINNLLLFTPTIENPDPLEERDEKPQYFYIESALNSSFLNNK